jgi:hypothetical protein
MAVQQRLVCCAPANAALDHDCGTEAACKHAAQSERCADGDNNKGSTDD